MHAGLHVYINCAEESGEGAELNSNETQEGKQNKLTHCKGIVIIVDKNDAEIHGFRREEGYLHRRGINIDSLINDICGTGNPGFL